MSPIEDHMSENFMGICKATCKRCDVNLTRIHLPLEVLEHNSNLSGPVILLKRKRSLFTGKVERIRRGVGFIRRGVV